MGARGDEVGLGDISTLTWAAYMLREFMNMRYFYPDVTDTPEMIKAHRIMTDTIETFLGRSQFADFVQVYRKPEFHEYPVTEEVKVLCGLCGVLLYHTTRSADFSTLSPKEQASAVNDVLREVRAKVSRALNETLEYIEEVMVFDCRVPHPEDNADYRSKKRALMMLGNYWKTYYKVAFCRSEAYVWYSPDPLTRYVVSLKARCDELLELIQESVLTDVLSDFLSIPLQDMDGEAVYIQEQVNCVTEQLETARQKAGSTFSELTYQEQLFLSRFEGALDSVHKEADDFFEKKLEAVSRDAPLFREENISRPETVSQYLEKVELRLREVVKYCFLREYGPRWLGKVKQIIGDEAYTRALGTLNQRKVDSEQELLHFTQLSELCGIISKEWLLFQDSFTCKQKDFNKLIAVIVKGRTDEAHHRPEHLWSEIERQRVRVACSDLLGCVVNNSAKHQGRGRGI